MMGAALSGCKKKRKDAAPCAKLEEKICEDRDAAFCKMAKEKFWSQKGPDGKKLAKAEIKALCKTMTFDVDVNKWGYAFQRIVAREAREKAKKK